MPRNSMYVHTLPIHTHAVSWPMVEEAVASFYHFADSITGPLTVGVMDVIKILASGGNNHFVGEMEAAHFFKLYNATHPPNVLQRGSLFPGEFWSVQ